MITTNSSNYKNRIPPQTKCPIAIEAMSRQQTITAIAEKFNCSRTTVHEQKNRALNAVTTSVDAAKGMTKGHELALPDTKLRYDHFHFIRYLTSVRDKPIVLRG